MWRWAPGCRQALLAARLQGRNRPAGLARRCCANGAGASDAPWSERLRKWWRKEEDGPPRRLFRLTSPAKLHKEEGAEVVQDLGSGELLEAVGDPALQVGQSDCQISWLYVRASLEENIEVMSERPLEYQDGWIHLPSTSLEEAEHQLGEKLAGRVDVPDHPVVNLLKKLPLWAGQPLPDWIPASVCELHVGKVGGIVRGGRFLLQRPAGAMPERLALDAKMLLTSKDQRWSTAVAAALGLGFAMVTGVVIHLREWMRGKSELGKKTWPQFVVWLLYVPLLVTPAAALPCYGLANSPGSTFCVIASINLLFYADLFSE